MLLDLYIGYYIKINESMKYKKTKKILKDLCRMFNFVRINAVLVAGIDLTKASHFKLTSEQASEQKG